MIITRQMFLVAALAILITFLFFVMSDKELVLYAVVLAGVIFVITEMRKDKLVMEGQ